MKKSISKLIKSPLAKNLLVRGFLVLAGLLIILMTALLVIFIEPSAEPRPFVFTSLSGGNVVGSWYLLYQFPVLGTIILGINFFLARLSYNKDRLISYLLLGAALLANLILLIDTINFIQLIN